jgi:hypothetical protein
VNTNATLEELIAPVIAGVDSYISLADADGYANSRLFGAAWSAAAVNDRHRALRSATDALDGLSWRGRPVAASQPLAWPRVASAAPRGYPLVAPFPSAVERACVELASHMLRNGQLSNRMIQTTMLGDAMTIAFPTVADELPTHIRRLIEPFLASSSANVAEVVL